MMTPLNILETARANLGVSSDRWHQGDFVGMKQNCLCAEAHVVVAGGGEVEGGVLFSFKKSMPIDDLSNSKAFRLAMERLREAVATLHGPEVSVHSFNDHPDTQYLDVLNAFDLAIEMEKQQ